MSFLPGLTDAASKAYTALDDIVEAASKGHDLLTLLKELVESIGLIFHHTGIRPSAVHEVPEIVWDPVPQHLLGSQTDFGHLAVPNDVSGVPTRDQKVLRDLQL